MAVKALVYGWGTYLVVSWLSSLGIFYSDIILGSDLHRWLPVIARAEGYFIAQGQLDYLKKTAWIYEKDLLLLALMLAWGALFCRFSLRVSFLGFFRIANYKESYLELIMLLGVVYVIAAAILGPDLEQPTRGIFSNKLYRSSILFGAFHHTLLLPTLLPLLAVSIPGFLDPIDERTAVLRH
ncbi:hypothetical protein AWM79_15945 [Pseudomonas agarici]|uniref:Uncharacterized protein n=1 Tax=Pseudomonas agarici TaxID=46677 RepID=A0A0X1T3R1_PSEAA|nr:hypothetical protein [Pseudomonas agarici]AMB86714.1 hypothetical protein AWM79_15945 [Pseudomonas agarici]